MLLAQRRVVLLLRHAHLGAMLGHGGGFGGHLLQRTQIRGQRRLLEKQAEDHHQDDPEALASMPVHRGDATPSPRAAGVSQRRTNPYTAPAMKAYPEISSSP